MDTIYNIEEELRADKGLDEVFSSLEKVLGEMGGTLSSDRDAGTISIINGKGGLFGDFLMEAEAQFNLKEKGKGEYLLTGTLKKKPSAIFWICLIGGICFLMSPIGIVGIIGVIIYFIGDLEAEYRKKLESFKTSLGTAPSKVISEGIGEMQSGTDPEVKKPRVVKEPPTE